MLFALLLTALPAAARELTVAQTAQMLAADVVILGEIHDNALHHEGQAALMAQLAPKVVVFEMLSPEMAARVNGADRRDIEALGAEIGWAEAGWPDIALYAPVFEALGDAVAVGAAAPREEVRAAFAEGAAAVFRPGAARFGLERDLPAAEQAMREQMQFEAHCEAMPLEMMGGMVEAQRLRDAAFSAATLEALEAHGGPVVVITGNGHARRDWGMPALLALAGPEASVYSVGFVEAPSAEDDPRFDMTIVTDPAPREDPCAAFIK
ncbi:ChaN family lipoprotein [Marimonas sp. MJW-29]|uniref:ChaN family lipoprotein n=1 Tax=Sulfitobacter sediminis TaxID=3234186 RepID=A0ABV3RRG0_9RHOB